MHAHAQSTTVRLTKRLESECRADEGWIDATRTIHPFLVRSRWPGTRAASSQTSCSDGKENGVTSIGAFRSQSEAEGVRPGRPGLVQTNRSPISTMTPDGAPRRPGPAPGRRVGHPSAARRRSRCHSWQTTRRTHTAGEAAEPGRVDAVARVHDHRPQSHQASSTNAHSRYQHLAPRTPTTSRWLSTDADARAHVRMFTARAATSSTVIADAADSIIIKTFAWRVSGIASVGLNAIALVNETYT